MPRCLIFFFNPKVILQFRQHQPQIITIITRLMPMILKNFFILYYVFDYECKIMQYYSYHKKKRGSLYEPLNFLYVMNRCFSIYLLMCNEHDSNR